MSDLNKKIYGTIEAWRNPPIEGEHPYVYLDDIALKMGRRGPGRVAIGGDRGQQRGLSGDSRHLRRREGGQGGLECVPQTSQGTRLRGTRAVFEGC